MAEIHIDNEDQVADRGIPSLDSNYRKSGRQNRGIQMAVAIGVAVLLVLVGLGFGAKKIQELRARAKQQANRSVPQAVHLKPLPQPTATTPPLPASAQAAQGTGTQPSSQTAMSPGVEQAIQQTQRGGSAGPGVPQGKGAVVSEKAQREAEAEARIEQIAQASPMAYGRPSGGSDASVSGSPQSSSDTSDTGQIADVLKAQFQAQNRPEPKGVTLGSSLKGANTDVSVAAMSPDPSLTMSKGTILTCALETALDSTVPGMTKCYLTEDVYSADSRTVLAERGSVLTGQYESSSLKSGMSRIFLLWTDLQTIHGVHIRLDSPATDALGRSGVAGSINNHFWQRFGAGLLLSVVDDVTASFVNRNSSTQSVQFSNTADSGQKAAQIALSHSVDIPPTLTKDQGGIVKVFVARDLYFGNVYGFRTTQR